MTQEQAVPYEAQSGHSREAMITNGATELAPEIDCVRITCCIQNMAHAFNSNSLV